MTATSPGGEVDALDPAGYGPINIDRAITIEGQGWSYIAPPAGGNGITINAVSGNVIIHGVSLNGAGITGTTSGIVFNSGGSLSIENCVVRNFTGHGIVFAPNTSNSLAVSDTLVTNNGLNGISVTPTGSGVVTAVLDRVESDNNGVNGIVANGLSLSSPGALNVTAADSVAAGNAASGFFVSSSSGQGRAQTNLMVTRSVAANNNTGLDANGASGMLWVGQTTVTGSGEGWAIQNNGVIQSYGTNQGNGNVSAQGPLPAVTGGFN